MGTIAVAAVGCSAADTDVVPQELTQSSPSTTARTPVSPTAAPGSTIGGGGVAEARSPAGVTRLACRQIGLEAQGSVTRAELVEASGLAASQAHPGVLWAVNDSGRVPGLYALDDDGVDRGFFELTGPEGPVSVSDTEDLALLDGQLYLADIGDNSRRRSSVSIYIVDEPQPGADGTAPGADGTAPGADGTAPGADGTAPAAAVITATYPDGPTDAEALLVDPIGDDLLILSKDADDGEAPTRLYSLALSGAADIEANVLELVGEIDVAALTASSTSFSIGALIFPGAVTGADISDDGRFIALRTYGSVWLFPRAADQTMAEALTTNEPCEGGARTESQGETVAFLPQRTDRRYQYVTISEGSNPEVNLATIEISDR